MSHTRIKICGIRDIESAQAAVDAGADAIGLVFVKASPRHVTVDQARAIVRSLPPFVEPVGLFVDEALEHVRDTCMAVGLHTVQLHGRETIDYARKLNDCRVIKAATIGDEKHTTWFTHLKPHHIVGLLLDAPPAPDSDLTGGSGVTFDWKAIDSLDRKSLPLLILAGGLTAANVGEAIRIVKPFAVDVSSGVESSRGIKDPGLIRAFCDAVRRAG